MHTKTKKKMRKGQGKPGNETITLSFVFLDIATLDATQLVLQEERRAKEEVIANKQNIERKSKEFIEGQQKRMEELNQAKVREITKLIRATTIKFFERRNSL